MISTFFKSDSKPEHQVFELMLSFVKSQCLYVATRLEIFDILDRIGEQSSENLAKYTNTDADRLYFILRAHI